MVANGQCLSYKIQHKPEGLAQAFILAEDFWLVHLRQWYLVTISFCNGLPETLAAADSNHQGQRYLGITSQTPNATASLILMMMEL